MLYAVKINETWHIANIVKAERFSEPREPPQGLGIAADTPVWSEDFTTAFLGIVGNEDQKINLTENKAKPMVYTIDDSAPTDITVLLPAGEIPLKATVTKRTGEKEYILVNVIRVFNDKGAPRVISADGGARFLAGHGGDFNVVGNDVLLLWKTTRVDLMEYLQGEDLEY